MKIIINTIFQIKLGFLCLSLLFAAVISISGCASNLNESVQIGSGIEVVTESDEPDSHKRARIRLELAVGYFEQGQTTIALDELKQSISANPMYADAYNLRGLIYMRLNDLRLAEESFKKALTISPKDSSVMHNLAWLFCQQSRHTEAQQLFTQALSNPQYGERAKTFRAQGLCQFKSGHRKEAEQSLSKSYEFDAGNPITAYNLAVLLFQRGDFIRSQFYIRRLNNTELANAESLWLGIKVENKVKNQDAMLQLGTQLVKRFPQSIEAGAYQRGAFDE